MTYDILKAAGHIDIECIPICDALNALPGIKTRQSCSGHGDDQACYSIVFEAASVDSIKPLFEIIDPGWGYNAEWCVRLMWLHCEEWLYCLDGPTGRDLSYYETIADKIKEGR